jgi:hypothetical protein
MDFQKVMNMIDDISHHLPEQKYIEIVNDLKKQYDNANDDDDIYFPYLNKLFSQLEYDLFYYITKKIILFKDDDIDDIDVAIDIFNHNFQYAIGKIIDFHTENTIKNNDMIWDFIYFVNCKKNSVENMVGKGIGFYYNDLQNRDDYIGLFGELALESVDWYLRQNFQSTRYINRCWSRLCLDYDTCYDGEYYNLLEDIQFPKYYFYNMTTESFEYPDELQYHDEF